MKILILPPKLSLELTGLGRASQILILGARVREECAREVESCVLSDTMWSSIHFFNSKTFFFVVSSFQLFKTKDDIFFNFI